MDYIRGGNPCGSSAAGELRSCSTDADCGCQEGGDPSLCNLEPGAYVCACEEAVIEGSECRTDPDKSCGGNGACVLAACRNDVAKFQRSTCDGAPSEAVRKSCESSVAPCANGGEQCKFLACVDRTLGNYSDGRMRMVGQ